MVLKDDKFIFQKWGNYIIPEGLTEDIANKCRRWNTLPYTLFLIFKIALDLKYPHSYVHCIALNCVTRGSELKKEKRENRKGEWTVTARNKMIQKKTLLQIASPAELYLLQTKSRL